MRLKYIFLICTFLLLCSCGNKVITIQTPTQEIPVTVEYAETLQEHAVGLMFRTELAENHGMLFIFTDMEQRGFWMKNTKIPLDILFIDYNGTIIDIKENFQPCTTNPCETYFSKPAQYVLEVNAGFVTKNTIKIRDTVESLP
ncbi:MAG: DUF192 domain-containing protein [Candidatus Woesearchaeota archaeon]|jgi:hypothetical protein